MPRSASSKRGRSTGRVGTRKRVLVARGRRKKARQARESALDLRQRSSYLADLLGFRAPPIPPAPLAIFPAGEP